MMNTSRSAVIGEAELVAVDHDREGGVGPAT